MVYDGPRSPGEGDGGTTVAAHATGPREGGRTIATAEEKGEQDPLPPSGHIHFSTLRGMRDRTISISSAGKTFSVTGWQASTVYFHYVLKSEARRARSFSSLVLESGGGRDAGGIPLDFFRRVHRGVLRRGGAET